MEKKKKSFLFPTLSGLCVRIAVLGFLVALAPLFGKYHWTIDLLSHFQVQATFGLFLLLFITLCLKKWKSSTAIFALLLLPIFHLLPLIKSQKTPSQKDATTISITTLNVLSSNQDHKAVIDFLKKTDSDLLVLCETTQAWTQALTEAFSDTHPHHTSHPQEDAFDALTLSKFPLTETIRHLPPDQPILLESLVETPLGPLTLFNAHPFPPMGAACSCGRDSYLANLTTLATAAEHPVIVAGDLNVTRWSAHYKNLIHTATLHDTADGYGFQPTWKPFHNFNLDLLGIPIDHILTSSDLIATDYAVGPNLGSDHRPVTVTLTKFKK